jgi:TP901 family phage tail tape measure protein
MAGRFSITAVFGGTDNLSRVFAMVEGRAKRAFRGIESAAASARKSIGSVAEQTDKAVGKMASAAKYVGAAAATAAAVAATSVVTSGADFEEAITAVGAVSLMTRDQIADLEQQALALGSSTKFTATQVANGMELMGRAGFTNNQVLASMPGLLAAAAAEGGELAETVGIVSNTLKGMGLEASQTLRVADVLTLASARTNSSITSLGESLKNAAPLARQFNIPLEHVTSAVALLQDVGIDASEAGTATATMLSMLAAPSKEAAAQIGSLGIKIADAHGNMLPLPKIFEQFAAASKKAGGNVKATQVFTDLLGMRGQRAGINLVNAFTSGKFAELAQELEGAAGSADKMATLRMQNVKGDWEVFTGAIDGVSTAIFGLSSGAMRGVLQQTGAWIDANKQLIVQEVDGWVKRAAAAIEAAIPIVLWFTRGLAMGFRDVSAAGRGVVRVVSAITGGTAGMFGDNSVLQAFNFGRALVWLTAAIVGVSVASRLATVWTYAYRAATIALKGIVLIAKGIQWAYVFATRAGAGAMIWNTGVTWANRAAVVARNVIAGISAGIQWAYNAAVAASTAVMGPATAATWALVAPLAAAAAALGSLYALYLAFSDLLKQTGGWGGIGAGLDSLVSGGSFFEGVDADLDRKAREEARLRQQGKKSGQPEQPAAAKVAASAAGAPAAKQTDVMVGNQGLFDFLGSMASGEGVPDMKGLSGSTDEASKQLDALTASLGQYSSVPPGMPGQLPGAMPGQPGVGGAPAAPMSLPTPQLVMPSEQSVQQGRLIAAEVKRVLEQTRIQVEVKGSGDVSASSEKKPRAGVNVSDSGSV